MVRSDNAPTNVDDGGGRWTRRERPATVLYVGPDEERAAGVDAIDPDDRTGVLGADGYDAALDHLRETDVDCLVTVRDLPDGDGVELCDRATAASPTPSTVLLVPDGDETVAAAAIDADVDGYVRATARTDPEAVATAVENALSDRRESVVRTFEALQAATRDLTAADSTEAVCENAVTIAREALDMPLSGVYLRSEDTLEPVAITREVEEIFGTPPTYTADDQFVWTAYEQAESRRFEDISAIEMDVGTTPVESGMILPLGDHGVHIVTATDRRAFSRQDRFFADLLASTVEAALDRTRATKRLRAERDRLARLFASIPDPAVEYRLDGERPIVESVNEAFESTFGYDEREVKGRDVDALLVPDDRTGDAREINDRVADGQRVQQEVERLTADGRRSFLLRNAPWDDGEGGYALYVDISDQKTHERTITALHGATRSLVRADSVDAIGETLVETARDVVDIPYAAVFDYDQDADRLDSIAATERSVDALGHPPPIAPDEGPVGTAFEEGERIVFDDLHAEECATGDGQNEEQALDDGQNEERPLDDGTGAVRSYCVLPLAEHGVLAVAAPTAGAFDDRTVELVEVLAANATTALDRLDRERDLRERERRLRSQNERLEAFASVVSHDLRNPLTVLSGNVDLAESTGDAEYFEAAREAIDRMEGLIDDLLVLARQGQTVDSPEPTAVDDVAAAAWAEVPTADADCRIETDLVTDSDPDRLRQLFANCFRNAIEHAGEDGPPTVEVGSIDDETGVYVADDGPGIPEDRRDRVFEHGFTTSSDGTGLGLKIVADVAEAHGWNVTVTESRWGGARFELRGMDDTSFDREPSSG